MTTILGQNLNKKESISAQVNAMRIPRFSYRKKFDPLEGNLTSDRRWGCSIRCCQGLLAQFIKKSNILTTNQYINNFFSNLSKINGKPSAHPGTTIHSNLQNTANSLFSIPKISPEPESKPNVHNSHSTATLISSDKKAQKKLQAYGEYPEYIHLFYDSPNSPFSIHSFCSELKKINGNKPGKWVKLSTLSLVLKNLLLYSEIETVIAENGQISLPLILDAFNKYHSLKSDNKKVPPIPKPSKESRLKPDTSLQQSKHNDTDCTQSEFNTLPVLILIPLMLGLKKLESEFISVITKALSLPKQSIGVIGGKNNKAYYIIGYTEKGEFLYFDPHEVHDAVLKHDDLYRVYEPELHKIKKMQLNPSLMIGFIVKTKEDIDEIKEAMKGTPITVTDQYITYSTNLDEDSEDTSVGKGKDNDDTDTDYDFVIVS
ncbi:Cysteine protease atg4a [Tritrichomonas musculus]|uniref:Cysteine protease n=1 Tax=Tritrichomonas musculus TaxID=1915356 RepID=A0ABR2JLI9_9EUKA